RAADARRAGLELALAGIDRRRTVRPAHSVAEAEEVDVAPLAAGVHGDDDVDGVVVERRIRAARVAARPLVDGDATQRPLLEDADRGGRRGQRARRADGDTRRGCG